MTFRHFIDLHDIPVAELRAILDLAKRLKAEQKLQQPHHLLPGASLAMIFEKNSTRTRVSFEVGIQQLGGQALYLSRNDLQLGRGESIADTARVLSRYVQLIMARCMYHETVLELSRHATVPIINGLTNKSHPCQIMADFLTLEENLGELEGKTLAWVGDCNNVSASLIHACVQFRVPLRIACPTRYRSRADVMDWAVSQGGDVKYCDTPADAVKGASAVFTDAWVSMGDEEPEIKKRAFAKYQVTEALMEKAAHEAIFLHCLPAYRGEEVAEEVIDGPRSVVFDEAENRLHVQKAIMLWCLDQIP